MKQFRIDDLALSDLNDAADWYQDQRPGLDLELIAEVDRVLERIEYAETFATAPYARLAAGVVRREFVRKFPYVVIFVETPNLRRVIMIRHRSSDPAIWRSRL